MFAIIPAVASLSVMCAAWKAATNSFLDFLPLLRLSVRMCLTKSCRRGMLKWLAMILALAMWIICSSLTSDLASISWSLSPTRRSSARALNSSSVVMLELSDSSNGGRLWFLPPSLPASGRVFATSFFFRVVFFFFGSTGFSAFIGTGGSKSVGRKGGKLQSLQVGLNSVQH